MADTMTLPLSYRMTRTVLNAVSQALTGSTPGRSQARTQDVVHWHDLRRHLASSAMENWETVAGAAELQLKEAAQAGDPRAVSAARAQLDRLMAEGDERRPVELPVRLYRWVQRLLPIADGWIITDDTAGLIVDVADAFDVQFPQAGDVAAATQE